MLPARVIWLLLFAFSFRCLAQPLPERRTLSGRVSMTQNKPVFAAQVTIKRKNLNDVTAFWGTAIQSDIAGEFQVPGAEDGDYEIIVAAPGYEVWKSDYSLGEYSPPLRVVLQRKVKLTFTLFDANGNPVRGRRASIFGFVTPAGVWQMDNTKGTPLGLTSLSDREGTFTFPSASEGVYHTLWILVPGVGYAIWPGKAQILEGGTHHIELQLQKAPASLRVRVVEAPINSADKERPVGGAQIFLRSVETSQAADKALAQWLFRQNAAQTNALSTKDGSGELLISDLLPGKYEIRAEPPFGCRLSQIPLPQTVEVGPQEIAQRVFRFSACREPQVPVQLALLDEKGAPLSRREVRFICQPLDETTQNVLQIEALQERHLPAFATRQGFTDDEGKMTLYPFQPALWQVRLFELNASLPFRGEATIEVTPNGANSTLEVTLRPIGEAE